MNKLMMAVAIGGLAVSANAVELSLKSNEDSVVWDSSTLTWIPVGGGELQAYGDCDVAHIGPDFTGSTVTIGGYMGPPELRFSNTQSITLKNGSESGNGFNGKLGVVNKYGTGNLILDFSDWRNYEGCDWHVYGGGESVRFERDLLRDRRFNDVRVAGRRTALCQDRGRGRP